jgi:hypothetical protein
MSKNFARNVVFVATLAIAAATPSFADSPVAPTPIKPNASSPVAPTPIKPNASSPVAPTPIKPNVVDIVLTILSLA